MSLVNRTHRAAMLVSAVVTVGCYQAPESVAPVRLPTQVSASFDQTWTAVVDVFAERNVPIRTMDRTSGFIASDELRVGQEDGAAWADCGSSDGSRIGPRGALYNVRVRGDSTHATVIITARWLGTYTDIWVTGQTKVLECVTTGKWESEAEAAIKSRAEAR